MYDRKCPEWYDFVIYAYFASKIGKLFFPSADEIAQLILAYGVFAIGFFNAADWGNFIWTYR